LAVELKSLNILFDDIREFWALFSVLNVESAEIVVIEAVYDFLILDLKLFDFRAGILPLFFLRLVKNALRLFKLVMLKFPLILHLLNPIGLKPFGKFEQVSDILPIDFSLLVDKSLMLLEIVLIAIEELVHVVVFEHEAELNRQKVVSHKRHQKHEVVDDILDCAVFDLLQLSAKLDLKVFPHDVDHY